MLTNVPIIEDRGEVYCGACQRYTEQWKVYLGDGHSPDEVMGLVRDILGERGTRPRGFTGCGGCVTGGVYGDKKLIASMRKLCAGADAKTREVVRQSVGEFRAEVQGNV